MGRDLKDLRGQGACWLTSRIVLPMYKVAYKINNETAVGCYETYEVSRKVGKTAENMTSLELENRRLSDAFHSSLPSELWLAILKNLNPVCDDLLSLSLVCKKWREIIFANPDPALWQNITLVNFRNCSHENITLVRFRNVLKRFGHLLKVIRLQKCHELFSEMLLAHVSYLKALTSLEISGMIWSKKLLRMLRCSKSLKNLFLEASLTSEGLFNQDDLQYTVEDFPQVKTFGLQFSVIKGDSVATVKGIMSSKYSHHITCLLLERVKMESADLHDVVKKLKGLRKFGYGNDQIYGLPSRHLLQLNSKSLLEVELFQVGDFAKFHLVFPCLKKLTMNACTSVSELNIEAPALRTLHFSLCVEVHNFRGISASFLHEMKVRRCHALTQAELIGLLIRNPDVKVLELEVSWPTLRLDHISTPSLENITIYDNGERLTSVDVRCPKLQQFIIKKSMTRSTILIAVSILSNSVKKVVLNDVPYLRKVSIDADTVKYLEVNFERRLDHVKPAEFTRLYFKNKSHPVKIDHLILKQCNLNAILFTSGNAHHISLEYCNLDCPIGEMIQQCGLVESLTLKNCYGPCQLNLSGAHLREVHVVSCTSLLMDHINLSCPSLVALNVSGLSFLPSQEEVDLITGNFREISPFLGSVKFSH
ncbi:uncharacterized protein LOC111341296 isoform X3 [Stylophora pistillata]|uniref:uncharacterized protein LOC111341296 isoform X3 n=1 Tax=Stylophora pistillata TaxID=50429 RepID=UPI000C0520DB|nr:uncharacterized protein LOC111341296 isoform X3 [Stylophora pistillata]